MTTITQKDVDTVVADNPLLTAEGFEHGFKRDRPEYVPARISVKEMQGAVNWLKRLIVGNRLTQPVLVII